jgi:hypothetical protein
LVREAALMLLKTASPAVLAAQFEAEFPDMERAQKIAMVRAAAIVGGQDGIALIERLLSAEAKLARDRP